MDPSGFQMSGAPDRRGTPSGQGSIVGGSSGGSGGSGGQTEQGAYIAAQQQAAATGDTDRLNFLAAVHAIEASQQASAEAAYGAYVAGLLRSEAGQAGLQGPSSISPAIMSGMTSQS